MRATRGYYHWRLVLLACAVACGSNLDEEASQAAISAPQRGISGSEDAIKGYAETVHRHLFNGLPLSRQEARQSRMQIEATVRAQLDLVRTLSPGPQLLCAVWRLQLERDSILRGLVVDARAQEILGHRAASLSSAPPGLSERPVNSQRGSCTT